MPDRRFLLVDADVLPEVFLKVLQAKELLASGAVTNISTAARQAGISRSAFYKYKDTVFDAEAGRESITVVATLLDKTGALQALLSGISSAGASIVTITQSRPETVPLRWKLRCVPAPCRCRWKKCLHGFLISPVWWKSTAGRNHKARNLIRGDIAPGVLQAAQPQQAS